MHKEFLPVGQIVNKKWCLEMLGVYVSHFVEKSQNYEGKFIFLASL